MRAEDFSNLLPEQIKALRSRALSRKRQPVGEPALIAQPRGRAAPLSYSQERLWLLEQLELSGGSYTEILVLYASGTVQLQALERSFSELISRHESLRTRFGREGGEAVQLIDEPWEFHLTLIDHSDLEDGRRRIEMRRRMKEEVERPFDLERGPLVRACVLRLSATQHVLLITMHHIISDIWSVTRVLLPELSALYIGHMRDDSVVLPGLPVQYADYALWQRGWLQGPALHGLLGYWKERLGGMPATLELPMDRARPAVPSFRGDLVHFSLSRRLTEALLQLVRQEGATPYMVLLAVFQLLLSRLSGQDDVVVGSPIAGRTHRQLEGLIGFFVNTLVLRTQLAGAENFRQLLRRVRETALGAFAHQQLPFERLVAELQPRRDLSRQPLFQVMFAMQELPQSQLHLPGLTLELLPYDHATSKFDLALGMFERDGILAGTMEYATDLFDRATIERFVGCFEQLLCQIAADPQQRLERLRLLDEQQRRSVLSRFGMAPEEVEVPARGTSELFEEQVQRSPDREAVRDERGSYTYGQLAARARGIAQQLRQEGLEPQARVALWLQRSVEMVAAVLGVWRAGMAYVPIDSETPLERVRFILRDSGARLLLTDVQEPRLWVEGEADALVVWRLSGLLQQLEGVSDLRQEAADELDGLAYVIYTSGTSGQPKGVMVEHRSLLNLGRAHQERIYRHHEQAGAGMSASLAAGLAFDGAVERILLLLRGYSLFILGEEARRDPALFIDCAQRQRLQVLDTTPSFLTPLLEQGLLERPGYRPQVILIGGEAIEPALWRRMACSGVACYNVYGPTEATINAAVCRIAGDSPHLGPPLPNVRLYILDGQLEPVPPGTVGEIHIAGAGVARGYLNRAPLTAQKFIANPFSREALYSRLYRTGDRGRFLENGTIEYLGRMDGQVKVRGYRIECGEIEAALREQPGIQQAIVVAREDNPGQRYLAAYYVPQPGAAVAGVRELRERLGQRLPEHMLPAAFVELQSLPLTVNGKVDRAALPQPDPRASSDEYVPPRTAAERTLAQIWQQVLKLDRVGIHDNFFELGGDSILATRILDRARRAGLRLTLRQTFEHQTIAELAAAGEGVAGPVHADQGLVEGEAPLTPIQRWFFELQLARPHHFNQAMLLECRECLSVELLERALRHLLRHHDALRLRFESTDGADLKQSVAAMPQIIRVGYLDLSTLAGPERDQAFARATEECQSSIRLTEGVMLRAMLFERGDNAAQLLLLVAHHLAVDAVSWRILLDDLESICANLRRGETVQLPAKTSSFIDWASRLQRYARSAEVQGELAYWKELQSCAHALPPPNLAGGANTYGSRKVVRVSLETDETRALLQELPSVYHTQINDVLLAALGLALRAWSGMQRFLIQLEGHGRSALFEDIDTSRTVGWFTAAFPVLLDLTDSGGPGDVLKGIKERLRTIPNHGIGYGLLRYMGGTLSEMAVEPGLTFNYMGRVDPADSGQGLFRQWPEDAGPLHGVDNRRSQLLEVDGSVSGDRLRMYWAYPAALYDRATIERLAAEFIRALRAIIEHCLHSEGGYTPSDFPLLTIG